MSIHWLLSEIDAPIWILQMKCTKQSSNWGGRSNTRNKTERTPSSSGICCDTTKNWGISLQMANAPQLIDHKPPVWLHNFLKQTIDKQRALALQSHHHTIINKHTLFRQDDVRTRSSGCRHPQHVRNQNGDSEIHWESPTFDAAATAPTTLQPWSTARDATAHATTAAAAAAALCE